MEKMGKYVLLRFYYWLSIPKPTFSLSFSTSSGKFNIEINSEFTIKTERSLSYSGSRWRYGTPDFIPVQKLGHILVRGVTTT